MKLIASLLETPHTFAVVGVSQDTSKYGYEVFETLTQHGPRVLPVNPKYTAIDGQPCYASLPDLPQLPDAVITAAPASLSAKIAESCATLGIPVFWMPPGTETEEALDTCQKRGITAIYGFCPVFVSKLPKERWAELP